MPGVSGRCIKGEVRMRLETWKKNGIRNLLMNTKSAGGRYTKHGKRHNIAQGNIVTSESSNRAAIK